MGYDILILTDHTAHTKENSVYALAATLASNPSINSVDIASRGAEDNTLFFDGNTDAILSVIPAVPRMTYRRALHLFEAGVTEAELLDYDFVILHLPHPIPIKLFQTLVEVIPEDHIINEPSGIIRTSSKAFLLELAELCPPMRIVKKRPEVLKILEDHPVVLKPLYGYAGQGITKLTTEYAEQATGIRSFHRQFFKEWSPPYLAMQYQSRVHEGDKRTIVVNGEIMGSAVRIPAKGKWICNVAMGGISHHATADKEELHIAESLTSALKPFGIVIFGFDTLVADNGKRRLSEINTMSIGGMKQIRDADGKPIMKKVVAGLVKHMDSVWFGKSV